MADERRKPGAVRRALIAAAVAAALVALLLVIVAVGARAWVDAVKADAQRAGIELERSGRPQGTAPASARWSAPAAAPSSEPAALAAAGEEAPTTGGLTLDDALAQLLAEAPIPGWRRHVRALFLAVRDEDAAAPPELRAWATTCAPEIDVVLRHVLAEPDGTILQQALVAAYPPDGTDRPEWLLRRAFMRLEGVLLTRAAVDAEDRRQEDAEAACRGALRLVALRDAAYPATWPMNAHSVLRRVRPSDPTGWVELLDASLTKAHALEDLSRAMFWPEPDLPVRIGSGTLGFATAEAIYEDFPDPLQQVVQRVVLLPPIRARWAAQTRTLLQFRDGLAASAECLPDPLPGAPDDEASGQWRQIMTVRAHALFTREILRLAADPGLIAPLASPCSDWGVTTETLEDGTIHVAITGTVVPRLPKQAGRERIVPAPRRR